MLKNYLIFLIKKRKIFLSIVLSSTLLSCVIAFILPKWYLAEASFLSPELSSNTLLSMSGGLSSVLQNFTGQSQTNGYNYLAILNSRTVNEQVIKQFNLMSVYGISDSLMSKTLKKLSENVSFCLGNNNETIISVYDKDPKRASDIANYYLTLVNSRGKEFANNELLTFKSLIEDRVKINQEAIAEIELRIKEFQEKEKMPIMITSEISGLEVIANIYVKRMELQLERDYILDNFGQGHPALLPIEREITRLSQRIDQIPAQTLNYMEIYREYIIQQKIAEYILPLFEQVKLSTAQKIPDVIVLDEATPPDRKKKPKRALIILITLCTSAISTFYFLLIFDKYEEEIKLLKNQIKAAWLV